MTKLKVASWNINSVRLRIGLVEQFLKTYKPDVLCLQETKSPNDLFPAKQFTQLGYKYQALHGQKGLHGVAIVSKLPLEDVTRHVFTGKDDCRHVSVRVLPKNAEPVEIHDFYVPSGGDVPKPDENPKFAHKLAFLKEMRDFSARLADKDDSARRILVGDLNVAPLEHDVWSHKQMLDVVSHTEVETERLQKVLAAHGWVDVTRAQIPEPEKVYTWWSYRARDWRASNRGRRLDHIWASPGLTPAFKSVEILTEARGWEKPSDHVPVIATFDV
jgi:exodeoxyribonuclease-3